MASRKNVRSTTLQISMLVDYMSTHTLFANGEYKGPLGREGQDQEWVRLQQLLQEYGPNKTVEQWRNTWRDLKKKARAEGAQMNAARAKTGNNSAIPSLSNTSAKILNVIGTESSYGMAGQEETGLGEIIEIQVPPATSPPPAAPSNSPPSFTDIFMNPISFATLSSIEMDDCVKVPITPPSSSAGPSVPLPTIASHSTPSTEQPTRGRQSRTIKNEFLVSEAETRNVLKDISNSLRQQTVNMDIKIRRSHLKRLHKSRVNKHENMGPKY